MHAVILTYFFSLQLISITAIGSSASSAIWICLARQSEHLQRLRWLSAHLGSRWLQFSNCSPQWRYLTSLIGVARLRLVLTLWWNRSQCIVLYCHITCLLAGCAVAVHGEVYPNPMWCNMLAFIYCSTFIVLLTTQSTFDYKPNSYSALFTSHSWPIIN